MRWVFSDAAVGTHRLSRWATDIHNGGILQIISVVLFNFAYIDRMYAEGCVDIKVKYNHSALLSLKFRF
jgi:hypothetical protein